MTVVTSDENRIAVSRDLPAGTLLEERYRLEAPIGRGGMATVYRARDRRLQRPVAVKVLHDAASRAQGTVLREAQVVAQLAHPHVVDVYDSGVTPDGRPYLVMELVDGQPVSRLAPLAPARALAVAEQVVAALAHAHARGIVHCDLKPQNVLLDAYGNAKLADFGVADADAAPVGEIVYGSAAYLAPERLRGAPTSPAVDVYALGALLYFLLTGRPPYRGANGGEVVAQVLAGPPVPPRLVVPGLPPAIDAIVRRAMAADPAERFPDATALRRALAGARQALRANPAGGFQSPVVARLRAFSTTARGELARLGPAAARRPVRSGAALAALLLVMLIVASLPWPGGQRADESSAGGVASSLIADLGFSRDTPPPRSAGAAAPATPDRPIRAEAAISDPSPRRSARLTVTGRLLRGDQGIPGVPMRTVWHFRSSDATCDSQAGTDAEGRATCTLNMSGATSGYEVVVDVIFEHEGQTYQTQVSFTPQ